MTDVLVSVEGYADSDDEERADLASRLRDDLLAHDLEVAHPESEPPAGSKGAALEWAQLVVSVSGSAPAMLAALQGWRGRNRSAAVSLEIDGDKLTLDEASPEDQRRLVESFLARHGAG
jgi:hypothetical protein